VTSEGAAKFSPHETHEDDLSSELLGIFSSIEKCIELRSEYMHNSLQCPGDNPKDSDDWGNMILNRRNLSGPTSTKLSTKHKS